MQWRCFPLEQVNSAEGPDWKLWEQPPEYRSRGRPAFLAALAAKRQGPEAFDRFHYSLLRAKWEDNLDHGKRETHLAVAERAGLDCARFAQDVDDPKLLAEIGRDYEEGRERHGVFGTPTFVFPNGGAFYLKLKRDAPAEDAVPFWQEFLRTCRDRPHVVELKRPTS